ncbi:MAG: hypothetical protein ABSD62_14435 [Candidatus Limnocylindrales bacterium]
MTDLIGPADGGSKNADSSRMGKAVEHLVAATCIIGSRAKLNVSTALVDDEGIDLVFHKRDGVSTLAVQVKARMNDSSPLDRGTFTANVRSETMRARRDLFLLFVAVDVKGAALDVCWLIQSEVFVQRATRDTLDRYRFSASAKPGTNDQWREYRLGPSELPAKILQYIDWVDAERLRMMRTLASFPPEPDSL